MAKQYKVSINGSVLRWAREEAGFSTQEAASHVSVTLDRYLEWEASGKDVPLGKLKDLGHAFRRQVATFFMTTIPPSIKPPRDFRNLKVAFTTLSSELKLAIRRAHNYQNAATQVRGESFWIERYRWERELVEFRTKYNQSEVISKWLRRKLEISTETQMRWPNSGSAFRRWRSAVENHLGILVFQFPLPVNEVQGFCVMGSRPYTIVINSRLKHTSRTFSLFHELAHIFRKQSGLCLIEDFEREQRAEEIACNELAAEFLLPVKEMEPFTDIEELEVFAQLFKVSREVYLRRARDLQMINRSRFFDLLDRVTNSYTFKQVSSVEKKIPREVLSQSSRGETFYNLVLDGVRENRLELSDAASLLGLRVMKVVNEL